MSREVSLCSWRKEEKQFSSHLVIHFSSCQVFFSLCVSVKMCCSVCSFQYCYKVDKLAHFTGKLVNNSSFFLRSSILKSSTSHIHKQCVREEALRTTSAGQQELNPVLCLNELLPRSEHRGKSSVFRQLYTLELTICSVFPFCMKIIRISTCLDCIIHHSEKLKKNKISALTLK